MKKLFLFLCLVPSLVLTFAQNDSLTLVKAGWEQHQIKSGITWKSVRFSKHEFFQSNQNIHIVEIAPDCHSARLAVAYSDSLEPTSILAQRYNAVVAVNGSFFKMRGADPDDHSKLTGVPRLEPAKLDKNRSVVYLRADGKIISVNDSANIRSRRRDHTGAVVVSKDGSVFIVKTDSLDLSCENNIVARDAMTSGPILLISGINQRFPDDAFCNNRHPRTAIGKKSDGTVVLLVADGRTAEANGMSIGELQKTLRWLGCTDALNLDGGGSTTMVIRGQPFHGVVNYPSDNKKFDHEGERDVANALVVICNE